MSRKWNFETRGIWEYFNFEEDHSYFVSKMCGVRIQAIQICNTLFQYKEGHRVLQFLDILGIYEDAIEFLFHVCGEDTDTLVAVILAYDLESRGHRCGGVTKKSLYHSIKKNEAMFELWRVKKEIKKHMPNFSARKALQSLSS
jgi:hypothetical protein